MRGVLSHHAHTHTPMPARGLHGVSGPVGALLMPRVSRSDGGPVRVGPLCGRRSAAANSRRWACRHHHTTTSPRSASRQAGPVGFRVGRRRATRRCDHTHQRVDNTRSSACRFGPRRHARRKFAFVDPSPPSILYVMAWQAVHTVTMQRGVNGFTTTASRVRASHTRHAVCACVRHSVCVRATTVWSRKLCSSACCSFHRLQSTNCTGLRSHGETSHCVHMRM